MEDATWEELLTTICGDARQMKDERIIEIARKTQVFNFSMLQDLVTLSELLERQGISFKELRSYFKARQKYYEKIKASQIKTLKQKEKEWNRKTRRCPNCTKPLLLRPITVPEGKRNKKGYTSHWYCGNNDCLFEEYTKDDYKELYTKVMERR